MGIVFVHISDLHISLNKGSNPVLGRSKLISGTIRSSMEPTDQCVLVISGDIADWGKEKEYEIAEKFLGHLYREISDYCSNTPIVVLTPGNHDLDFTEEGCAEEIRNVIIDKLSPSDLPTESMTEYCLLPQKNFRKFAESAENNYQAKSVTDLLSTHSFVVDGSTVRITLVNTARFSKKVDIPGNAWLPVGTLEQHLTKDAEGAINIVIMHHPFSWNREGNKKDVDRVLEKSCDIVFTGHVHEPDIYGKSKRGIEQNLYVEGGVIQDHEDYDKSSFNIVRLCQDGETFTCTVIHWNGTEYEPLTEPYQHKFLRLRQPILNLFDLQEDWANWLEQVGTDFRHPRKPDLRMSDIFVYPDLQRIDVRKACSPTSIVRDKDVLGFIQEKKRVLIAGVEKAGKTSLAKQLFKDFRLAGYVPLLIRSDFKVPSARQSEGKNRLWTAIDSAVEREYHSEAHKRFWNTKISERVLIVDDYSRIKIADGAKDEFIRWVDQNFGTLVVLCSPGLRINEILNRTENDTLLWGFEHVDILESDAETRHHLISKWIAAGQDLYQVSAEDIYRTCVRKSQIIDAVIYQGIVPSLPLFIIMMMQQLDGHGAVDATNGLYWFSL